MKKLSLILFLFAGLFQQVDAQVKLGHVNSQDVIANMQDYKDMQEILTKKEAELTAELTQLDSVLNAKYQEYLQAKQSGSSQTVITVLESDLQELEQRIQQRSQQADQNLRQLQQKLQTPLMQRVDTAIKEVCKEGGYLYVFDTSTLLFVGEGAVDLTPLVKQKLGVSADATDGGGGQ